MRGGRRDMGRRCGNMRCRRGDVWCGSSRMGNGNRARSAAVRLLCRRPGDGRDDQAKRSRHSPVDRMPRHGLAPQRQSTSGFKRLESEFVPVSFRATIVRFAKRIRPAPHSSRALENANDETRRVFSSRINVRVIGGSARWLQFSRSQSLQLTPIGVPSTVSRSMPAA